MPSRTRRGAGPFILLLAALLLLSSCGDITEGDSSSNVPTNSNSTVATREIPEEAPHEKEGFEQPEAAVFSKILAQGQQAAPPSLASTNSSGQTANSYCYGASLSGDGKYLAFMSRASNLHPAASGNTYQVYRKNLDTGAVDLISQSSSGAAGSSSSYYPKLSHSGDAVAFYSYSSNLVPGVSGTQVYLRDMTSQSNSLVSHTPTGARGNSSSYSYDFGGNDFVVFYSYANNLVSGDTNARSDVFVWNRQTDSLQRASLATGGAQANNSSYYGSVSADGQKVAFRSYATNLHTGSPTSSNVFVRDLSTGVTTRIDTGGHWPYYVVLSDDGTRAAYSVWNSGVSNYQVYAYDLASNSSILVGYDSYSSGFEFSQDGRYLAYTSYDQSAQDNNHQTDVYVYDFDTGVSTLVSEAQNTSYGCYRAEISEDGSTLSWDRGGQIYVAGNPVYESGFEPPVVPEIISTNASGDLANGGWQGVTNPRISDDGCFVSFESRASNLHPEASSSQTRVYRKSLATGEIEVVSRQNGTNAVAEAYGYTAISADGSKVAFSSRRPDLTSVTSPGTNYYTGYIRDLNQGVTYLMGYKVYPSDFGTDTVAVWSSEPLAGDNDTYYSDTFLFRFPTQTFDWVSQAPEFNASASSSTHRCSDDGRYSLFKSSGNGGGLHYRDNQTGQVTQITADLYFQEFEISGDGRTVAYVLNSTRQLYLDDLDDGQPPVLVTPTQARAPHLSDDGRYLLFFDTNMPVGANTGSGSRAYVFDSQSSQSLGIDQGARYSGHMELSGDGKTVVYQGTVGSSNSQIYVQRNPHL